MKKLLIITGILFVIYFPVLSEDLDIKSKTSWLKFIYKTTNLDPIFPTPQNGVFTLSENNLPLNQKTDLLLTFNQPGIPVFDETGHYSVAEFKGVFSQNIKTTGNAFNFMDYGDKILFYPYEGALFRPGNRIDSFTLQFNLYPTNLENDQMVLHIGSPYYDKEKDKVIEEEIKCTIKDQKVIWEINNFFFDHNRNTVSFKLIPTKRIFPERWSLHTLVFSNGDGSLTQYIDGNPETILYATENGKETGTKYNFEVTPTNPTPIIIGESYSGIIDDIAFYKDTRSQINQKRFNNKTGELLSNVIPLGEGNIKLSSISSRFTNTDNSQIQFFYRISKTPFSEESVHYEDNFYESSKTDFLENNYKDAPRWEEFQPTKDFFDNQTISGNFLQIKLIFFPGTNDRSAPILKSIHISTTPDNPPVSPKALIAIPEEGKVTLKWHKNTERDIQGYLVYYGEEPGVYFGKGSTLGDSPIDLGLQNQIEISGLTNEKLYYFTVTAYDSGGKNHQSQFSDEVIARPGKYSNESGQ